MCHGEGIGLDHIRELLFGSRSSRLVLVVSDLVSDLEAMVVSTVESRVGGPPHGIFSQSISYISSVPGFAGALRLVDGHGWDRSQACFQVRRHKGGNCRLVRYSFFLQHSRVKNVYFQLVQSLLEHSVQPSLSFYAIKVNAVSGQPGLIHSPQLVFDIHKDHPSGILTCKIPQDVVPPDHSFVVSSPCCSQ